MFVQAPEMLNAFSAIALHANGPKNLYHIRAGRLLSGLVFHGQHEGEERINFEADLIARRAPDDPNVIEMNTLNVSRCYTLAQRKNILIGLAIQMHLGSYWRIKPNGCSGVTSIYQARPV